MNIIEPFKVINLHVPKTGGTTIMRMIKSMGEHLSDDVLKDFHVEWFNMHVKVDKLPEEVKNKIHEYEILVTTRNTYERMASLYAMETYDDIHLRQKKIRTPIRFLPNPRDPFFSFFMLNGEVLPNVTILNFDNLENEIRDYWKNKFDITLDEVPHFNRAEHPQKHKLKRAALKDKRFLDKVYEQHYREIDKFGYTPPSIPPYDPE